jgi:PilZ domain
LSASTARVAQVNAPDRRRHRRAPITVGGRILSAGGFEQDCRSLDISIGGARFVAPSTLMSEEAVLVYLDELGRLPGTVARVERDGSFGVKFDVSTHKQEKLSEQLTWMLNKGLFAHEEEERRATRRETAGAVPVTMEDGTSVYCDVRDFSLVGCSMRTLRARPPLGAWVQVGQTYGRVSRYLDDGFAVDFQPKTGERS